MIKNLIFILSNVLCLILFCSVFFVGFDAIQTASERAEKDYEQLVSTMLEAEEPDEYGNTSITPPDHDFNVRTYFIKYIVTGSVLSVLGIGGILVTFYLLMRKLGNRTC